MSIGSGLLALALIAAEAPAPPAARANGCDDSPSFQLKVITVDGLAWRTDAYPRLKPVARQGTATIWTTDRALAAALESTSRPGEGAVARSNLQGEPTEGSAKVVHYVAHVDRVADGPINEATAVAFLPEVASVEEGVKARVDGRRLDQGILARLALDDTHVEAMHTVTQGETVKPVDTPTLPGAPYPAPAGTALNVTTQVPEVSRASVNGEWLIPNDGVLLISLGVHTAADAQGKAVVRERLVVLEVKPRAIATANMVAPAYANIPEVTVAAGSEPTPIGVSRGYEPGYVGPSKAADVQAAQIGFPPLPDRSTPQGVDANGQVVTLPPLPEGLASADLDRIKPAPNQPSPQSNVVAGRGTADPLIARTAMGGGGGEVPPLPVFEEDIPFAPSGGARFLKKLIESGMLDDCDVDFEADASALYFRVVPKLANASDDKCDQADESNDKDKIKAKDQVEAATATAPACQAHCDNGVEVTSMNPRDIVGAVKAMMSRLPFDADRVKVTAMPPGPDGQPGCIDIDFTLSTLALPPGLLLEAFKAFLTRDEVKPIELPSARYFHDDVQYIAVPQAPAPAACCDMEAEEDAQVVPTGAVGLAGIVERGLKKIGLGTETESACGRDLEPKKIEVGVEVKDLAGVRVTRSALDLTGALKAPGQTKRLTLPVSDKLALEIKATVVPIQPEAAGKPGQP